MSFAEFAASILRDPAPPADLSPALRALWLDARDDWDGAHAAAQEEPTRACSWVHAYLHRKEGDIGNAGYWYARAKRTPPDDDVSLQVERDLIARELLGDVAKN